MSCPDWRRATAWRRGDGAAPEEWPAALAHLAGCGACRQQVAGLDPTLLLAAAAAPAPQPGEDDIHQIKSAVRSLVTAERMTLRDRPDRRALLAAAALVTLLVTPIGVSRLVERPGMPEATPEMAVALPEPVAVPPVEEVQPAAARVYQFGTEELPVVLIFDENLDL